jgi:hypothetical protein
LSSIITLQSGRPFTLFAGNGVFGDIAAPNTERVGGVPGATPSCVTVDHCATLIARNTYIGDPLYAFDLRLSRYFTFGEKYRIDLAVDAFNVFNRPNVDEVSSVYGSPVFCGAVPQHYRDATTTAIQHQSGSATCPASPPTDWLALGLLPVFVPPAPSGTFGTPRTMMNPRQFQFSLKLSF